MDGIVIKSGYNNYEKLNEFNITGGKSIAVTEFKEILRNHKNRKIKANIILQSDKDITEEQASQIISNKYPIIVIFMDKYLYNSNEYPLLKHLIKTENSKVYSVFSIHDMKNFSIINGGIFFVDTFKKRYYENLKNINKKFNRIIYGGSKKDRLDLIKFYKNKYNNIIDLYIRDVEFANQPVSFPKFLKISRNYKFEIFMNDESYSARYYIASKITETVLLKIKNEKLFEEFLVEEADLTRYDFNDILNNYEYIFEKQKRKFKEYNELIRNEYYKFWKELEAL